MPLDGITAHFLSEELNITLADSRIDKIYQINRYDICLHVRSKQGHVRLLLSCNPSFPRIHIAENVPDNPKAPPSFCMLLRKHLSGGRITKFSSPPFERIIEIHITSLNELQDINDYRLIIELMGRYSNIILLNSDSIILDSILHVDSRTSRIREVMPARRYEYPPGQGKMLPCEAIFLLKNKQLPVLESSFGRPIEKALLESLQGFSPQLAHEICHTASVDPRKGCRQLSQPEIDSVIDYSSLILSDIKNGHTCPSVYYSSTDSVPIDFHALKLHDAGIRHSIDSISMAIDRLHEKTNQKNDFIQMQKPLLSFVQTALAHAIRKKQVHEKDILDAQDHMKWKKYGDLILVHQRDIPAEADEWTATDYEDTTIDHNIPLDPSLNASENAQYYYRKYRKGKSKYDLAHKFLREDIIAVEYLTSLLQAVHNACEYEDIVALRREIEEMGLSSNRNEKSSKDSENNRPIPGKSKTGKQRSRALRSASLHASAKTARRKSKESKKSESTAGSSFRKFVNDDGTIILCGRNNIQNDILTFKTAAPDDLWFHAKNRPGSHVVLRLLSQKPSEKSIYNAAGVAAYYSSATTDIRKSVSVTIDSSLIDSLTVEVDFCEVKRVNKIPRAKPGMVTYDRYQTLLVSPSLPGKLA
ncbi:MAG: NFACT family protein [Clostridiales bacterium]|nr:NFACT family protein [Clostridiales bacterium]